MINETIQKISEKIIWEIGGVFPHTGKRLRIWSDVDKYRWKEDESIWKQQRGKTAKEYEIYFDKEFICSFSESENLTQVFITFANALKRLVKEGKIFVNEAMYLIKDEEEKARIKSLEVPIPTAHTPEEKILRDILIKTKRRPANA